MTISNNFYILPRVHNIFDFSAFRITVFIFSPGTFSFAAGYFVDGDVIVPDCRFHGLVLSPMRALTTLLCPRWYSLADPSFFTVPHLNSVVDT